MNTLKANKTLDQKGDKPTVSLKLFWKPWNKTRKRLNNLKCRTIENNQLLLAALRTCNDNYSILSILFDEFWAYLGQHILDHSNKSDQHSKLKMHTSTPKWTKMTQDPAWLWRFGCFFFFFRSEWRIEADALEAGRQDSGGPDSGAPGVEQGHAKELSKDVNSMSWNEIIWCKVSKSIKKLNISRFVGSLGSRLCL